MQAALAANRSTSQFVPVPGEPRVLYEPGAEAMANVVASDLPAAVELVQQRMGDPFTISVRVYVCATIDTLTSYGASPQAGGFTMNHRVFISPKPENTPERMPSLLAHELTHLLLQQRLSLLDAARVPVWFSEGLAVEVSGGGGAEGVTEEEARGAIAEGRLFVPEGHGGLLHRDGASAWGLPQHLFYREAGMFVASMRAKDGAEFAALLHHVEDGEDVGDAFRRAYGMDLGVAWEQFRADAAARRR